MQYYISLVSYYEHADRYVSVTLTLGMRKTYPLMFCVNTGYQTVISFIHYG